MVKKKNTLYKFKGRELRVIIGAVVLLIGISGLSNIVSILLIIAGGYLIYEALK